MVFSIVSRPMFTLQLRALQAAKYRMTSICRSTFFHSKQPPSPSTRKSNLPLPTTASAAPPLRLGDGLDCGLGPVVVAGPGGDGREEGRSLDSRSWSKRLGRGMPAASKPARSLAKEAAALGSVNIALVGKGVQTSAGF